MPEATRRSARLRLEALTRSKTSFGFGSGFGRSRTSTPFSPRTAAFIVAGMALPPFVLKARPVLSSMLLPSSIGIRQKASYEPARPPENRCVGLSARLPVDLRPRGRGVRGTHHRPHARRARQCLYGRRDLRQGRPLRRARESSRPP